jgi:hypothetical protein
MLKVCWGFGIAFGVWGVGSGFVSASIWFCKPFLLDDFRERERDRERERESLVFALGI